MSRLEKIGFIFVIAIVGGEVIRHHTGIGNRPAKVSTVKPFQPVGMSPYASVARRA